MATFSESLQNTVRGSLCGFLSDQSALEYTFADAIGNIYDPSGIPGTAAWWKPVLCNTPPPPTTPPPFTGGQCLTNYQVNYIATITNTNTGQTFPQSGNAVGNGKVGGIFTRNTSTEVQLIIQFGVGTSSPSETVVLGAPITNSAITNFSITSVVRIDGLPDNCGNPPVPTPSPLPPGGNVTNTNITYNNNDGVDVTVPVVLIYGKAYVNVRAEVNIPVEVQLNATANFTANVNLSTGGITVNIGGGSGRKSSDDTECDGSGNKNRRLPPGTPNNPIPNPPDTPEPDDTESIFAAIVTVTTVDSPKPTIIGQNDNPDIYAPALGYISFLITVGNGNASAWTSDIPVKNLRQFIPCPWDGGAIAVKGTPIPGVEFDITPVRREFERPKAIT